MSCQDETDVSLFKVEGKDKSWSFGFEIGGFRVHGLGFVFEVYGFRVRVSLGYDALQAAQCVHYSRICSTECLLRNYGRISGPE